MSEDQHCFVACEKVRVKGVVGASRTGVVRGSCVKGGAYCCGDSRRCLTKGKDAVVAFASYSDSREAECLVKLETNVEMTSWGVEA